MSVSFSYDDSLWPLLIIRLEGPMSDSQYEEFFAHGHSTLLRRERYVSIFDLSRMQLPTPEQRQRLAQWTKAHETLLRESLLGSAFVLSSPFVRMMLSLIFHIAPTPAPYVVVPTVLAGVPWAITRLEQSGFSAQAERIQRHYFPGGQAPRL
jgi:hypothetical protein